MLNFPWVKKTLLRTFSIFIVFLTWFIRLDIFIGDVTIWIVKTILLSIGRLLKKGNLDFKKKAPAVFHAFDRLIHNPIIGQDRSFKVGLATIFILIFAIWFTTRDLPSPKQENFPRLLRFMTVMVSYFTTFILIKIGRWSRFRKFPVR